MNKNNLTIILSIIIGVSLGTSIVLGKIIYSKTDQNTVGSEIMKNESPINNNESIVPNVVVESIQTPIIESAPLLVSKPKPVLLAHIISVTPQYKTTTRQEPYNSCHEIEETVMVARKKQDGTTGGVIGGVTGGAAGAIIGKQVSGNGNGTALGGVLGAVVGAVAGNQIQKQQTEQVPEKKYKQVCSTEYSTIESQSLSGYKVAYEYNGKQSTTTTHKKPKKEYVSINTLR